MARGTAPSLHYIPKMHRRREMPSVSSTAISRIEWSRGTLSIWFHSSQRYDYPGVAESTYLDFLRAGSKGQFYNNNIKDRY
ncbi:MAG: KTSC domain-containing protein [Pseudomonadota bacterium]